MKKDELRASVNKHFRIQPAMQIYSDAGKLIDSTDDAWIVEAATDTEFILKNRASHHQIPLGYDSYVGFQEDPRGKQTLQIEGILVLKAQLYMFLHELRFAVTAAPGRPMHEFLPPIPRKNVGDVIREGRLAQALAEQQKQFAWSQREIESA